MNPIHRIPSSIRVRRSDTNVNRNSYYCSADTYANRTGDSNLRPPTPRAEASCRLPSSRQTPSAQTPSGQTDSDYFSLGSWQGGSATTTPGLGAGPTRKEGATPHSEENPLSRNDSKHEKGDDETLRLEMQAARRAIHDEEQRERRESHGQSSRHATPTGDFPSIRLNDESLPPHVPSRSSSRRPGAVESLAMRHRSLHKEERRRKRREQRDSISTTSSQSSNSDPSQDAPVEDSAESNRLKPSPSRDLSDVQEEGASRAQTGRGLSPSAQPQDGSRLQPNRPRRNTVADEGIMAASRRIYDNLIHRRSDRDVSATDPEQQAALVRPSETPNTESHDTSLYSSEDTESSGMHEDEVVDYLDVVDPEIATVTALQNVGNSIFFPPIPFLYNRRPTISLPSATAREGPTPSVTPQHESRPDDIEMGLRPGSRQQAADEDADTPKRNGFASMRRVASMVPGMKKKQIPATTEEERRKHIKEWALMDEDERCELDEHVHLLLTKKAKFKRAARGFWRYVKTPHGFIITTYAFLITFWGTAICLFLLRWINVHNPARQRYWIEICDQILCALFAAVGLGFAPFRAVDTYRMVQIAHYHFLTYKRRKELNLPKLKDKNELPRATPRVNVGQMTNTMLVKTGLRKNPPLPSTESEDVPDTEEVMSADNNNEGSGQRENDVGRSANSSWELLSAIQSRQSTEVEELKEKRAQKHKHWHRKKHHTGADDDKEHSHKKSQSGSGSSSGSPPPAVPKTYANKDGIIPLGQLKRNPSIASELPRDAEDIVVLSPKQQANLEYQQRKFHESHTFYRYRETVTHRPFELRLMMAIVILLDCHSCLQASLGGTTWGIYYKNRPTSVTATIITFSLSCNAVAGILIWLGGSRTKKKEEVERLLRIALEEEALRKMKKRHRRELEAQRAAEREWEANGGQRGYMEGVNSQKAEERQGASAVEDGNAAAPTVAQTPALERIQEH